MTLDHLLPLDDGTASLDQKLVTLNSMTVTLFQRIIIHIQGKLLNSSINNVIVITDISWQKNHVLEKKNQRCMLHDNMFLVCSHIQTKKDRNMWFFLLVSKIDGDIISSKNFKNRPMGS